ncbi:hypothetical protein FJY94_01295 [Candidatus Kaiserbacteria bacterium]|nr:hypothetical protein [Candidatus Kaiserbacteria bacterium]
MPTLHERMQRLASDPIVIAKLAAVLVVIAIVAYVFTVYAPRPVSEASWEADAPLTQEQKRAMMESLEQSTDTRGRSLEETRNEQGLTPERRLELIGETGAR